MAESVRNLPGFFHCEKLGCSLFPDKCGMRFMAAEEGHQRMLPCKGCPVGAAHAMEHGVTSPGLPPRFLLNIALGRSKEARARREAVDAPRQTYPEAVREAKAILARIDARRAKK